VRTLASFCETPMAHAVIHAAKGMANLQVFCREKSGNGCRVSVYFWSLCVRGPIGHAYRVPLWHHRPARNHRRLSLAPCR